MHPLEIEACLEFKEFLAWQEFFKNIKTIRDGVIAPIQFTSTVKNVGKFRD
jgi:hypothetical protein